MKHLILSLILSVIFFSISASFASAATYYVATTGNDSYTSVQAQNLSTPWKTIQKGIDNMTGGDTVYIRGGTYNEPANFFYKTNTTNQYMTLSSYNGETVILDGTGILPNSTYQEGLIYIKRTNYVRISGLKVQNVNMAAIYASYMDHLIIEHNLTYDTVSTGVGVWFVTNVIVDSNDIGLACNAHPNYPQSGENFLKLYGADGFEVKNNLVHKASNVADGTGGEGLNIEASRNGTVHHNIVHMDERPDGLPPNKFAYAVDAWNDPTPTGNIQIYDNVAYNSFYGFIVTSEEGGTVDGVKFYNNLAYNITRDAYSVHVWSGTKDGPKKNIQFINNTAYNNGYGFQNNSPLNANVEVRNNIFSNNTSASVLLLAGYEGQFIIDHNLCGTGACPYDLTGLTGDPKLANAGVFNFHLLTGSAAINNGSATGAPATDFDGNVRPQGAGYDIGAYEYTGSVPTPSPTPTITPTPTPVPGDVTGDGHVNLLDFLQVSSHYNTNSVLEDLNHDGKVNLLDLAVVLKNFGR